MSRKIYETTKVKEHSHTAVVSELTGIGRTTGKDGHFHIVNNWECEKVNEHSHKIKGRPR